MSGEVMLGDEPGKAGRIEVGVHAWICTLRWVTGDDVIERGGFVIGMGVHHGLSLGRRVTGDLLCSFNTTQCNIVLHLSDQDS